jgi:1-acyl-sn-glycerol-3-phosphate acyltransferase
MIQARESDADYKPGAFYWFARWVVRVFFFKLLGGFQILHMERVPPSGAVILAPNHVSFADPPAVACSSTRPLRFMAQWELFKPWLFNRIIRALGSFPVRRGEADSSAIRVALAILARGDALLVFPEGRRGNGQTLQAAARGLILLASKSEAPIVPIGICGTGRRLPKGRFLPRISRVTVVYGEPFRFSDLVSQLGEKGARERFPQHLMERIADALSEGGQPTALPESRDV